MLSLAARSLLRAPLLRTAAPRAMAIPAAVRLPVVVPARMYSTEPSLSKTDISNRILDVLKSFDKVDPSKVTSSSAFSADLGLDSLDAVEVVMAIEEEFNIEIPDGEADGIQSVQQAIDYIAQTPEAS